MSDNPFMEAMGAFRPDETRCVRLAERVAKIMVGHTTGEGLMALCFHLHRMLADLSHDPTTRALVLAGIMRLIDPDEGSG